MGSAPRHLSVDCAASRSDARANTSSVNFTLFVNRLLSSQNRNLETLRLRNLYRLIRDSNSRDTFNDLFQPLITLIESQESIQALDVTNANLSEDTAIRLFESVRCPEGVRKLYIADVTSQTFRFNLAQNKQFVRIMGTFISLTDIGISEEYISHELLMTLSRTVSSTLRRMEVDVIRNTRTLPGSHQDLEDSWNHFCVKMNDLYLSFKVTGRYAGDDVVAILPNSVVLCSLMWRGANFVINVKSFCLHVAHFKDSLDYLDLLLRVVTEEDAEYLVRLVKSLKKLKSLHISSPTMSLSIQLLLEGHIRRYLTGIDHGERILRNVYINREELILKTSWSSYIIEWLSGNSMWDII